MIDLCQSVLMYACGGTLAAIAVVTLYRCVLRHLPDGMFRFVWRHDFFGRILCAIFAVVMIQRGSTKFITHKSASDDGILLTMVDLSYTNGVAKLTAASTGAAPEPAWFREAVTNDWTPATADGWVLTTQDCTYPGYYTNVWIRAETNNAHHAAWYFGENPPPVEIAIEGGVEVVSMGVSGRRLDLGCNVPSNIVLSAGSQIVVEMARDDNLWTEEFRGAASNGTRVVSFRGFWLDRRTRWRVRLEVPR